jgi:hypothetical protein
MGFIVGNWAIHEGVGPGQVLRGCLSRPGFDGDIETWEEHQ